MVRGLTIAVGIGLIILWIAGLSSPVSSPWLTWLDGIAGLFAFSIAGGIASYNTRGMRGGSTFVLSLALFTLWIIALATGVVAWQTWWTFAFACAQLVIAFIGGSMRPRSAMPYPDNELERKRREEEISRRKVS